MPSKPKKPCPHCGKLTGVCSCQQERTDVIRKQYDKQRGTAHERGYDAKWTQYSRMYRHLNPLCVMCKDAGILTSVEKGGHVDHIQPVSGPDDPLFWKPSNHQSLCHSCHAKKTAKEDGGFGNAKQTKAS